ncbi:MAG: hypothetical protein AVDCRST_MAG88-1940 [uncultured Thermomicrobiales bacterium]|uniref:Uncharacterized protein n=1 Tax=uncultured Thermomicrobiales bacterium TaxID=1645740 RepID=A0A6J4V3U8_9BACT|nr:MAG: hypothetical protein AVDCRST_MAG88-1940 [uncultured Thermomicrobiales bacterium]
MGTVQPDLSSLRRYNRAVSPISPLPQVQEPGQYPTAYRVSYDAQAREYRIALSGLVTRP